MPYAGIAFVLAISALAGSGVYAINKVAPPERREKHNEVLGFVHAAIGMAYAIILGLVLVQAWGAVGAASTTTYTESNALLDIDWYARSLPQPAQTQIQDAAKQYASVVINVEWPLMAHGQTSAKAQDMYTNLRELVQEQEPKTQAAVARYTQVLQAVSQLGDGRRERIDEASQGVPLQLWGVLIVGAVITIAFACFFGMCSPRTHALGVFALTLLIGLMLLVLYEMNYPFGGAMAVGPDAFQVALQHMNSMP